MRASRCVEEALALAKQTGDLIGLERAYVNLTDSSPSSAASVPPPRLAAVGTAELRRHGVVSAVLTANHVEALLALGEWDECDRISSAALRAATASFPYMNPLLRADLETGRGDFDSARAAPGRRTRDDARRPRVRDLEAAVAELALWERRWTDAHRLLQEARARAGSRRDRATPRLVLRQGAPGPGRAGRPRPRLPRCRGHPPLDRDGAASDRRRPPDRGDRLTRHPERRGLVGPGRGASTPGPAAEPMPPRGTSPRSPGSGSSVPPLAAYCRWRETEALLGAGATRSEAAVPLRSAYAVATRMRAAPLARELEALARRGRVDLRAPERTPADRSGPCRGARTDPTGGGGAQARRAGIHEPRDRPDAGHQREDHGSARDTHPAQARRTDPARGRGDRSPVGPLPPRRSAGPTADLYSSWSAGRGYRQTMTPSRTATLIAMASA